MIEVRSLVSKSTTDDLPSNHTHLTNPVDGKCDQRVGPAAANDSCRFGYGGQKILATLCCLNNDREFLYVHSTKLPCDRTFGLEQPCLEPRGQYILCSEMFQTRMFQLGSGALERESCYLPSFRHKELDDLVYLTAFRLLH